MKEEQYKILIAEDDRFLSEIYFTKLSSEGFKVTVVPDGEQALEKIKAEMPDLLLLDILMPKLSGIEVLKKISSEEATKNLPVVVLTNVGEKSNVEEALQNGAKDYLIKSQFTPEEVVEKVKTVLTRK